MGCVRHGCSMCLISTRGADTLTPLTYFKLHRLCDSDGKQSLSHQIRQLYSSKALTHSSALVQGVTRRVKGVTQESGRITFNLYMK